MTELTSPGRVLSGRYRLVEPLARGGMAYDEYSKEFMVGTPEQIVERLRPMVDAGINYFIVYMPRVAYEPEMVERFAREVIPSFS